MSTRGERNNNPGNIRHGSNWLGLADEQPDKDFCTFTDPKFGFRALAKVLLFYQQRYGIDTIRDAISRWAPPNENNTDAYMSAVAAHMGCDPDTHLDLQNYAEMYPLVDAITRHENGRNIWPRNVIDAGLALAGIAS